ncbi:uncharacterized protein NDAI_0A03450 [Naumovozyma dairenensis CBS 421]|uniref:mRNA 5'-phosphatase n=1 Tax=Naumovozyma dairenensis (strain ATCC 10597 / BCRC 20456 / CBS 421 / NBRC 0211 / NRRL Y-12639) TaxID=1071378 RepID=G0W3W4_NAUDC|nr:hypothetical protein NDAI_0A03450 [Naumovozyma dairenensis CBS 421]CCD22502.1 hypothetical protein NDAI_0A03450 [Naumovozyma dairenensis CBS 421]
MIPSISKEKFTMFKDYLLKQKNLEMIEIEIRDEFFHQGRVSMEKDSNKIIGAIKKDKKFMEIIQLVGNEYDMKFTIALEKKIDLPDWFDVTKERKVDPTRLKHRYTFKRIGNEINNNVSIDLSEIRNCDKEEEEAKYEIELEFVAMEKLWANLGDRERTVDLLKDFFRYSQDLLEVLG